MISASQLLHARLGAPAFADVVAVDAPCWVCGGHASRALSRGDWMGALFVGQNKVRAWQSDYVCEACACVTAWTTPAVMPVPGRVRKAESTRDPNWRNYSVLVDDRGVVALTKGDKGTMRDWLRGAHSGHWFAAIADSGQKHVIPWTPVNASGATPGRVLFEERELTLGDWALADEMTTLLTAGATKETMASGDYTPGQIALCGDTIEAFESRWARERAGAWWELALWLSQRDEAAVAARMEEAKRGRKAKTSDRGSKRGGDPGGTGRVSRKRRQPNETLGSDPGPGAERSPTDGDDGGVANAPPSLAPTQCAEPRQRTLF